MNNTSLSRHNLYVNISNSSLTYVSSEEPNNIQIYFMGSILIIVIILNTLVLIVVPQVDNLKNSTGVAMVCLAVSDLGVGLCQSYVVINGIYSQSFILDKGSLLCNFPGLCVSMCCGTSLISLTFLNLDKYLTIRFPLRYQLFMTTKKAIIILSILSLLTFLFFLPPAVGVGGLEMKYYHGFAYCLPHFSLSIPYSCIIFVLFMVVPTIIIMVSVMGIYRIAKKQSHAIAEQESVNPASVAFTKRDVKLVRTLMIMTVGFYLMWSPFFCFVLIWEVVSGDTLNLISDFGVTWLALSNSCVNPLVYIPTMKAFRLKLISLFRAGENGELHA